MDKLFDSNFINFFNSDPFLIKSTEPFSDLTSFSLTIDLEGQLLLTLSRSLDQLSGLEASKPLVDSALFDSSTRLLHFNLKELAEQKNRLERIQKNSRSTLGRPEYSCEFVAVLEASKSSETLKMLEKLGITVNVDETLRPSVSESSLKNLPWFNEINFEDSNDLHHLFNWIGRSLKSVDCDPMDDSELIIPACKHLSIEAPLLPFQFVYELLNRFSSSSSRLILSLKVCQRIPPPFELNSQRLKHFNERKFDATVCTADQRALIIYKSPEKTISFQLNAAS